MKPLPAAPLTDEDKLIVALLDVSYAGKLDMVAARDADRRDAELMFHLEATRATTPPNEHAVAHSIQRAVGFIGRVRVAGGFGFPGDLT